MLGADFAPRDRYIKVNGVKSGTPPLSARLIDSEQTADGEVRPTEGTVAHLECALMICVRPVRLKQAGGENN